MPREYEFNGYAGCVEQRKNRQTGLRVGLYRNDQAGLDDEGGSWSTVCEEHGHIVAHETLALARSHLADPLGWCEFCCLVSGPVEVAKKT